MACRAELRKQVLPRLTKPGCWLTSTSEVDGPPLDRLEAIVDALAGSMQSREKAVCLGHALMKSKSDDRAQSVQRPVAERQQLVKRRVRVNGQLKRQRTDGTADAQRTEIDLRACCSKAEPARRRLRQKGGWPGSHKVS